MSSDGRYDVIIIGSGAGGGTLARHLAPSGQADPDPRTRRLAAARARELGLERGLRRQPLRAQGDLVRREGQALPAGHPLRGRRRDEDVRGGPLPPPAGGLRRAPAPRRDLAGLADLVRRHGAVLHEGRAPLRGPRQPRRGLDRGPRERPVPVPGADPRAPHPAAVGRPGAGRLPPVPRALRRPAPRGRPAQQPAASGAGRATASRAWSRPSPMPRCSASGRRWSTRTSASGRAPSSPGSRRTRPEPRSSGSSSSATAPTRPTTPTSSSSRPARPTRPRSCWRRPTIATRTGSPTGPARSAGTTCSTTAWRSWRSPRNRTRRCSRRRSG